MPAADKSTVVGIFEHHVDIERALNELRVAGFDDAQLGVARKAEDIPFVEEVGEGTEAGAGAAAGAVAGLGLGALAGLGVLMGMVPVIGPAIMAGTLGIILSNAAAGAGVAGLIGALVGAGIPEHEAFFYQDQVVAGHTILTIKAGDRSALAAEILRRNGARDASDQPKDANAGATSPKDYLSTGSETIVTGVPPSDYEERIL